MLIENIDTLKTIFSEREPYSEAQRFGGSIVIFDPIFLKNFREAMSTGCMIKMSESGFNLANDFVSYADGVLSENHILKELDKTLVDIVECTYVDKSNECMLSSVYEFNECGV